MKYKYLLILLACGMKMAVRADVITIGVSRDATIFSNNVNNSNVAGPGVFAGTNSNNSPRRSLLEFDIAGSLPANAIITGVELKLTLGQVAGSGGGGAGGNPVDRIFSFYRLLADWGQNLTPILPATATGASATAIGGTGQGFPANPGDVTWNESFYQQTSWTTPGGDFAATASVTLAVPASAPPPGTVFTWPSTPALVADVQQWYDNPNSNYGWLLKNDIETGMQGFFSFYSREWSDRAENLGTPASNAEEEPMLTITYVPEPTAAVLLLIGVCGTVATRRRGRGLHARR